MNCPSCGAPVAPDATSCGHCGARLAMVACPSCFGMVFVGAKYCSQCGAAIAREEIEATQHAPCPRCRVDMEAIVIGDTHLRECPKCEGIWADTDSLQHICADSEEQAAVLGVARTLPEAAVDLDQVRYVPCPVCNKLMNRVAFAHCSRVVVDVCRAHGTWFDKDELRRIVESYLAPGGLEAARADDDCRAGTANAHELAIEAASFVGVGHVGMESRRTYYDSGLAAASPPPRRI